MEDLAGLGKFVVKLMDVVQTGTGRVYNDIMEPKRRKKLGEIDAENEKKMTVAKAEGGAKAMGIKYDKYLELQDRANSRANYKRIRGEKNIEDIVAIAGKIGNEEDIPVSDKKLDSDWIDDFFEKAEKISDEEMKAVWARILTEEVKRPGTTTKRTLGIIKSLEKNEAKTFEKICGLVSDNNRIYKIQGENLSEFGLSHEDLLLLIDAGLLNGATNLQITSEDSAVGNHNVLFKNKRISIEILNGKLNLPVFLLTKSGEDIYKLFRPNVNEKYYTSLFASLEKKGHKCNKVAIVN